MFALWVLIFFRVKNLRALRIRVVSAIQILFQILSINYKKYRFKNVHESLNPLISEMMYTIHVLKRDSSNKERT